MEAMGDEAAGGGVAPADGCAGDCAGGDMAATGS